MRQPYNCNAPRKARVCGMDFPIILVVRGAKTLNPLFTPNKKQKYDYFQKSEQPRQRQTLAQSVSAWRDTMICINRAHYHVRSMSFLFIVMAMIMTNQLAQYAADAVFMSEIITH
jgi:hypothetical protein